MREWAHGETSAEFATDALHIWPIVARFRCRQASLANVIKDRATYGYRRIWARLRLEGHERVNHKRV